VVSFPQVSPPTPPCTTPVAHTFAQFYPKPVSLCVLWWCSYTYVFYGGVVTPMCFMVVQLHLRVLWWCSYTYVFYGGAVTPMCFMVV
jgi:hypothetical protein